MSGPKFEFSAAAEPDGRIDTSAFHRNHVPIWAVLSRFLANQEGDALEIGSGSGQHVIAFARETPALTWWPSDPIERHRKSIAAWRAHSGLANVREPLALDLAAPRWGLTASDAPNAFDAIFCANVIHVAPFEVAGGLLAGAGARLRVGGRLFLYGPFRRGGLHTAPSNLAFDEKLRQQNPDWGVRDIDELTALARDGGLLLADTVAMPANNLTLIFERSA